MGRLMLEMSYLLADSEVDSVVATSSRIDFDVVVCLR